MATYSVKCLYEWDKSLQSNSNDVGLVFSKVLDTVDTFRLAMDIDV